MTLPVKHEESAEQLLGTSSLEMLRARADRHIRRDDNLNGKQRKRIIEELDFLIENERKRRARLASYQRRREELEHERFVAEKQTAIRQKRAEVNNKIRLLEAQTAENILRYRRDCAVHRIELLERLLQLRAKYKPTKERNPHIAELLKLKKQQGLTETREQAVLNTIARRATSRAAFITLVNKKYPDMAEELIDYYDQQVFRQGIGRK